MARLTLMGNPWLGMLLLSVLVTSSESQIRQAGSATVGPGQHPESTMLESTFRLVQWREHESKGSLGTVLLLTEEASGHAELLAVTARHVLGSFRGDYATIDLRARGRSGSRVLAPCQVRLRERGTALYAVPATEDVAVFRLSPPGDLDLTRLARFDWLTTDATAEEIELEFGSVVFELGFPLGVASNSAGYPILRSGVLAPHPIFPLRGQPLLADIPAFEGASGGPIYVTGDHNEHRLTQHPWILGIVSGGLNSSLTAHPEPLGIDHCSGACDSGRDPDAAPRLSPCSVQSPSLKHLPDNQRLLAAHWWAEMSVFRYEVASLH